MLSVIATVFLIATALYPPATALYPLATSLYPLATALNSAKSTAVPDAEGEFSAVSGVYSELISYFFKQLFSA